MKYSHRLTHRVKLITLITASVLMLQACGGNGGTTVTSITPPSSEVGVTSSVPSIASTFSSASSASVNTPPASLSPASSSSLAPVFRNLTINVVGAGQVTFGDQVCDSSCAYNFTQSAGTLAFNAIPGSGAIFTRWEDDCFGQQSECRLSGTDDIAVTAVFDALPTGLAVESLSLINAATDQAIPNFDPLTSDAVINLDDLGVSQLNIRANPSDQVASVTFEVNDDFGRTESRLPYALAGDDGGGDYVAWNLPLGDHQVVVIPFDQAGAQGNEGPSLGVRFRLEASRLQVDRNSLSFDAMVDRGQAPERQLVVTNDGNAAGEVTFTRLPAWLSVDGGASISVNAGQQVTVTLRAEACTSEVERSDELMLNTAYGELARVAVTQVCLPFTNATYDLSLERAYFMQSTTQQDSTQPEANRVPLVANREALVRAFVVANENTRQPLPRVFLHYELQNGSNGQIELAGPSEVATQVDESNLNNTFYGTIPEDVLQQGIEVYFVIDPNNQVPESNERNNRYPAEGSWTLDARVMPSFDITFIPVAVGGVLPQVSDVSARELLDASIAIHPIDQYTINIRAPYTYTGADWEELVNEIASLRRADRSSRYYHGLVERSPSGGNIAGIGAVDGRAAVSRLSQRTIAHELGHNFGLPHAPCGNVERPDANFPYAGGTIGVWGLDPRNNSLKAPGFTDYMSYCRSNWTSDYNYFRVLDAIFNNRVRNFKITGLWNAETWSIKGNMIHEVMQISEWQKLDSDTPSGSGADSNRPGPYWARLIGDDNQILGEASFALEELDHSTQKYFYTIVANDYPGERIVRVEVGMGDEVLHSQSSALYSFFKPTESIEQSLSATRLDDQRVEIQWPANGQPLVIKNTLGHIIAKDRTGQVILFTQDDNLTGTMIQHGTKREIPILVN